MREITRTKFLLPKKGFFCPGLPARHCGKADGRVP